MSGRRAEAGFVGVIVIREGTRLLWLGGGDGAVRLGRPHWSAVGLDVGDVALHHADVALDAEGRMPVLTDLATAQGTFVNGERIEGPTRVGPRDSVRIGDHVLEIAAGWTPTGREETFLSALLADPADDDTRLVFADWLEESGDLGRAELLRHGRPVAGPPWWRALVAHQTIDRCSRQRCPGRWELLLGAPGKRRDCASCNRQVHYCVSADDLAAAAAVGEPVAFDVAAALLLDTYFRNVPR